MRASITLVSAAIVVALVGAGAAVRGHAAAGVVFVALAIAMACTALNHRLRKDPRS